MIAWIRQKLAFWFPAVGESGQSELDRVLVYANLRRQHVLVWVFVSFHLAIICQDFVRTGSVHLPYLRTGHLGLLVGCIIFLIATGRPTSPAEVDRRHRFCEGVVFLLFFLGAGLQTGFAIEGGLSIVPYVLIIFLSAAFFYLSGLKLLALFGLAWSVWLAMVWRFPGQLRFPAEILIAGTLGTVMAMITARSTYLTFVKDFLSLAIIEQHKQQQRELKTLNEISARLAHEIRNPLMSAGGFARRLSSAMSPEDPNRAKAEVIVKEVGRLEAILSMILNYLKPLELNRSPVDPNESVTTALHRISAEIRKRKTGLDLHLGPELPKISVDPTLMEKVMEVLLKDALSRMPEEATLFVETSQEKYMFKLVIRYPALHMSVDDVEDFFYPFTTSRIEHDTRHDAVDLPKSRIIVEKHGGEVNVTLQESGIIVIEVSLPLTSM
jgi:signal transduction histidine kinase